THRRIRMSDLLDYRQRRRARQFELLAEMQADLDDEVANGDMERELRAVRTQVAESRKSRPEA
ncbi:MAG: DNA-binding protein, partial [Agrococcus sp.]